jgi:peptidoglycan-associated lipoprotein
MQHCLGGQACNAVKNGLIAAGMTADRINTISHGKESPFCTEHNEACWQQYRRSHFVYRK